MDSRQKFYRSVVRTSTRLVVLALIGGVLTALSAEDFSPLGIGLRVMLLIVGTIALYLVARLARWGGNLVQRPFVVTANPAIPVTEPPSTDQSTWFRITFFSFALGVPVLCAGLFLLLAGLASAWRGRLVGFVVDTMPVVYWILPAAVLSVPAASLISMTGSYLFFGPRRYGQLRRAYDRGSGLNNFRLGLVITLGSFVLFGGLVYFGLANYTRFDMHGVFTRRPDLLTERAYAYNQVVGVEHVFVGGRPEGAPTHERVAVHFIDGWTWRGPSVPVGSMPESYLNLLSYVSQQSGKPVLEIGNR